MVVGTCQFAMHTVGFQHFTQFGVNSELVTQLRCRGQQFKNKEKYSGHVERKMCPNVIPFAEFGGVSHSKVKNSKKARSKTVSLCRTQQKVVSFQAKREEDRNFWLLTRQLLVISLRYVTG